MQQNSLGLQAGAQAPQPPLTQLISKQLEENIIVSLNMIDQIEQAICRLNGPIVQNQKTDKAPNAPPVTFMEQFAIANRGVSYIADRLTKIRDALNAFI